MLFTNQQISTILQNHANALEVIQADPFKVRAYARAAESIENLSDDVFHIWKEGDLESIPGVGKSISSHLAELFKTGKVADFERVKKRVPNAMFELSKLPGVGPKRAYQLAYELSLNSVDDLKQAIKQNKVQELEGFGEKLQQELAQSIVEWESLSDRHLLAEALPIANDYLTYLKQNKYVEEAECLGSLRRKLPTVGDIDLAVVTANPIRVLQYFVDYPLVRKVINQGDLKSSVILKNNFQVDIMTTAKENWGALLQHFTGSKEHNVALRVIAKNQGWTLSEKQPIEKEEDVYKKLGLQYIFPELREDTGEIQAAGTNRLPLLVELKDIKGDMQMHTQYSDGICTVEELADRATKLSYQYICITDHAPSLNTNTPKQVNVWIQNRKADFAKAEKKFPKLKIINGVEVNIPVGGGLALPNEVLREFDWVIASVHSGFKKNSDEQTKRIIWALENEYVNALGHPTGRLLLNRPSIDADWREIFKAAAKNRKYMEINAHPTRLDLYDSLIREAKSLGVKFVISTDAHTTEQFENMQYGVYMARRGWLEMRDVINTETYAELATQILKR